MRYLKRFPLVCNPIFSCTLEFSTVKIVLRDICIMTYLLEKIYFVGLSICWLTQKKKLRRRHTVEKTTVKTRFRT